MLLTTTSPGTGEVAPEHPRDLESRTASRLARRRLRPPAPRAPTTSPHRGRTAPVVHRGSPAGAKGTRSPSERATEARGARAQPRTRRRRTSARRPQSPPFGFPWARAFPARPRTPRGRARSRAVQLPGRRYERASERCSASTSSEPAKAATVAATLATRARPRPDSGSCSTARVSRSSAGGFRRGLEVRAGHARRGRGRARAPTLRRQRRRARARVPSARSRRGRSDRAARARACSRMRSTVAPCTSRRRPDRRARYMGRGSSSRAVESAPDRAPSPRRARR